MDNSINIWIIQLIWWYYDIIWYYMILFKDSSKNITQLLQNPGAITSFSDFTVHSCASCACASCATSTPSTASPMWRQTSSTASRRRPRLRMAFARFLGGHRTHLGSTRWWKNPWKNLIQSHPFNGELHMGNERKWELDHCHSWWSEGKLT